MLRKRHMKTMEMMQNLVTPLMFNAGVEASPGVDGSVIIVQLDFFFLYDCVLEIDKVVWHSRHNIHDVSISPSARSP